MQRSLGWALLLALAVTAAAVFGSVAQASQNGTTISIAFARDDANTSFLDPVNSVVGAPPYTSANWINETGQTGSDVNLVRDDKGIATVTGASVTWSSNNTWSSSRANSNNQFTGDDFLLMDGYLDSSARAGGTFPTISVTGLDPDIAAGYSVVIYCLSDTTGRFGHYTVNGGSPLYVIPGGDGNLAIGNLQSDYAQATGNDNDWADADAGNYMVFPGLSGDLTITTAPRNFRVVINAIQIVKN
jgi:hypothetical protein